MGTVCRRLVSVVFAGQWSDWQPFGPCKSTHQENQKESINGFTQNGEQTRSRFCLEEDAEPFSDEEKQDQEGCIEGSEETEKLKCRIPTVWSIFKAQGECSVTCGVGKVTMTRICTLAMDMLAGQPPELNDMCQLGSVETILKNCRKRPCPVNGGWSEWSAWGPCGSAECSCRLPSDVCGQMYRIRTCSKPIPKYGGKMCEGAFIENGVCLDPVNCATDGVWSPWENWSDWNCELGNRNKTRRCDSPPQRNGGKKCDGNAIHFTYKIQNLKSFNDSCGTVTVEELKAVNEEHHGNGENPDNRKDFDNNENIFSAENFGNDENDDIVSDEIRNENFQDD